MNTLKNQFLEVSVTNEGAELCSIWDKNVKIDYLWGGNPSVWGRKAPILFPIVGKVKNNTYMVDNLNYSLPQHGFARDRTFERIESTETKLILRLSHSEDTLTIYPYPFILDVQYELVGKKLIVSYTVKNEHSKELYFSIGAHPGFNCPLFQNGTMDDYYLKFSEAETLSITRLENGLITSEVIPFLNKESKIELTTELFKNDALIFSNYKSAYLSMMHKEKGELFKFHFKGYPYLGIWSKPGPFICIEPWYGIADHIDHNGDFTKKTGIQHLAPKTSFSCEWAFELI